MMVCGGGLPGSYRILFVVLDTNNDCPIAIERDIKIIELIDNISMNDVLLIGRSLLLFLCAVFLAGSLPVSEETLVHRDSFTMEFPAVAEG